MSSVAFYDHEFTPAAATVCRIAAAGRRLSAPFWAFSLFGACLSCASRPHQLQVRPPFLPSLPSLPSLAARHCSDLLPQNEDLTWNPRTCIPPPSLSLHNRRKPQRKNLIKAQHSRCASAPFRRIITDPRRRKFHLLRDAKHTPRAPHSSPPVICSLVSQLGSILSSPPFSHCPPCAGQSWRRPKPRAWRPRSASSSPLPNSLHTMTS